MKTDICKTNSDLLDCHKLRFTKICYEIYMAITEHGLQSMVSFVNHTLFGVRVHRFVKKNELVELRADSPLNDDLQTIHKPLFIVTYCTS